MTRPAASLVNAEGERLTPSVVLFEGDEVIVGREAVKALSTEADLVATCAKRDVGYRVFHKVLNGKQYPPEVIEAFVLNKLRGDAGSRWGTSARWSSRCRPTSTRSAARPRRTPATWPGWR